MQGTTTNLGKILVEAGKISQEILEKALVIQKDTGKELKSILIDEKFLTEDGILSAWSYCLNIPFLDITKLQNDPKAVVYIVEGLARRYSIFPLYKIDDTLVIAACEPLDVFTADNLRMLINQKFRQVLSRQSAVTGYINAFYKSAQSLPEILEDKESIEVLLSKETVERLDSLDPLEESKKEPIIKITNLIINEAIAKGASDIHLEPTEEALIVRYRIDGVLHKVYTLPRKSLKGIAARIKILANLDITKFYLPQDGRFPITFRGRAVDFRVSSLPVTYGEKFVLRILDKSGNLVSLDALGFSEGPLKLLKEAVSKEHGMILITGPTGSGKSTTLYAILSSLNTIDKHIVSIEDPVEYRMDGIGQTQVKPEVGLDFAKSLRGILRQSPDIIMLGEIRDGETADIAIKASLVGQLIFSTLHTNDAVSAFARLIDMGVEKYLVASSLILICAQRLARRICFNCKVELSVVPEEFKNFFAAEINNSVKFYEGKGCPECYNTGYRGRVALLEAFSVDSDIKKMVINNMSLDQIKEFAIRTGKLITLRQDGLKKAFLGLTTIEEVYRVTVGD